MTIGYAWSMAQQNNESAGVQFVCIRPFFVHCQRHWSSCVSTLELSESFLCSLPCLGVFIKCQSGTSTAFLATKLHWETAPGTTQYNARRDDDSLGFGLWCPLSNWSWRLWCCSSSLGWYSTAFWPLIWRLPLEQQQAASIQPYWPQAASIQPRFLKESLVVWDLQGPKFQHWWCLVSLDLNPLNFQHVVQHHLDLVLPALVLWTPRIALEVVVLDLSHFQCQWARFLLQWISPTLRLHWGEQTAHPGHWWMLQPRWPRAVAILLGLEFGWPVFQAILPSPKASRNCCAFTMCQGGKETLEAVFRYSFFSSAVGGTFLTTIRLSRLMPSWNFEEGTIIWGSCAKLALAMWSFTSKIMSFSLSGKVGFLSIMAKRSAGISFRFFNSK